MEIQRVYVEFMGFVIADPVTFFSDVSMAALCFFLAYRLKNKFDNKYALWASLFFLFLGISTFMGGASHLLDYYFGKGPHLAAWIVNGVSVFLAQLAAIVLIKNKRVKKWILAFCIFQLVVFASIVLATHHFLAVKINSAVGLILVVTSIHFVNFKMLKNKVYLALPLAILSMTVPLFTHAINLEISELINRNVISHVLLLPCFYLLYLAHKKTAEYISLHQKLHVEK